MDVLINESLKPTKEFITNFFQIESGYINTKHPDFLDCTTQTIMKQSGSSEKHQGFFEGLPKREQNEILLIEKMLVNYHNVVKKNVCDYIPKIIITLLVKRTTEECETVLIKNLY